MAHRNPTSVSAQSLVLASLSGMYDRSCLVVNGTDYSRSDLMRRVADVQQMLLRLGIGNDGVVLWLGDASLEMYALLVSGIFGSCQPCFLGINQLSKSSQEFVRQLRPSLILHSNSALTSEIRSPDNEDFPMVVNAATTPRQPRAQEPVASPTDITHISLSSGTFSIPKVSLVSDSGIGGYSLWATEDYGLSDTDTWFEPGNPTSDLALTNAIMCLAAGCRLVVAGISSKLSLSRIAQEQQVTALRTTPQAVRLLVLDGERRRIQLPALRLLGFGGDRLPEALPTHALRSLNAPAAKVLNTYGKSEVAGIVTRSWIEGRELASGDKVSKGDVSIGEPIPDLDVWLEGNDSSLAGEILLQTDRVAVTVSPNEVEVSIRQYDSLSTKVGSLPTKTGDLARLSSGWLFFDGRADRQIKINGYRVNLEELDRVVSSIVGCQACVVLGQGGVLAAIVESDGAVDVEPLNATLSSEYSANIMIRRLICISELPRTRSGKVDLGTCQTLALEC